LERWREGYEGEIKERRRNKGTKEGGTWKRGNSNRYPQKQKIERTDRQGVSYLMEFRG
jgi:hypothetical protein